MDNHVKNNCDDLLKELEKFSTTILTLGEPITDDRIKVLEKKIGLPLPDDYTYIISKYNGFSLMGNEVLGIRLEEGHEDLLRVYLREHNEVAKPLPSYFVPFSPNGRGDHYCFDTREKDPSGTMPVVFWQWDYPYDEEDIPEVVNENFVAWVQEVMIEWTLEDTNYDGTDK